MLSEIVRSGPRMLWATILTLALSGVLQAEERTLVVFETSAGEIRIEMNAEKAPVTVENFLEYVDNGFFDGTIFHRTIPGFVIQGGGFTPEFKQKETREPIANEADNGLKNTRGSLSMARTQAVESATSQFFVNLADNAFLDHGERDFGYAVFAHVVEGMDVVDRIAAGPTTSRPMPDSPREPVVVERAYRAEE